MDYEEKAQARFWSKVNKTEGCWVWTGPSRVRGYAGFLYHRKTWLSHRLAYVWAKGEIPAGLVIDHLCRNRACVNPDHLEAVTNAENVLRGESFSAVNARKTVCAKHGIELKPLPWQPKNDGRRCALCAQEANRRAYRRYEDKKKMLGLKWDDTLSSARLGGIA